jgi:O-antigen/teichoic acid export membrane protein
MKPDVPAAPRPPQDGGRLVRNVLHLGSAQVASTLLGFALMAALGRFLGPADFGHFVTITMIWVFVYVVIDWGQATILIREASRGRENEPVFFGSALTLRILGTLCALVLAIVISRAFSFDSRIAWLVPLTVLIQVPWIIAHAHCYMFRARNRMDADAIVSVVGKGLTLAATLIVLTLGGGLAEVIWAQIVGTTGSLAISLRYARQIGISFASPSKAVCREFLINGVPLAVLSFTVCLQPLVEVLLLSHLTTPDVVGWYGAGRSINGLFLSPAMILIAASFPALSRAASELSEFRRILEQSGKVVLIAASLASASLYIFADFGVALIYGKGHFEQTSQILRVSAVFLPIWCAGYLFGAGVNAFGRAGVLAVVKVLSILVSALVSWFLVKQYQANFGNGAIALVITAGLAEVVMLIATLLLMPSGSVGRSTIFDFLRAYVTAATTVVVLWPLRDSPVWLVAPIFGLAFGVVAMGFGLILPAQVARVVDVVRTSCAPRTAKG